MAFITDLITDRTPQDLQRWKKLRDIGWDNMTDSERAEWESDLKGAYNSSDLNRVGEIMNVLRDYLIDAGYLNGLEFLAKTDWLKQDIPTAEQFTNYINAIKTLRGALAVYKTTPPAPSSFNSLTIEEANSIEKILIDVYQLFPNMMLARNYCGEIFCGEIGR